MVVEFLVGHRKGSRYDGHAGKISTGFICEVAGVDRYRFYEECAKHKIPVINYEPGELEAKLKYLCGA
ncbi:UPF0175 family protein [Thiothrix subterranea]|uniref:UPF0175 family protein n=1 Tax=Thiothrix subterranea TaxID=2735563 RepID=A0ABU0Y2S5_9GAMM|nr:UPF0175 family protein [Thiothrix subterranea]MDQ5767093.1 UPF0175 family protein [Thiothrix subterranea]